MKIRKSGLVVIAFLLIFTSFLVYTIIYKPKTGIITFEDTNYILYKGRRIDFRAIYGECKAVPIEPSLKVLQNLVKNSERLILLIEPDRVGKFAVNIPEIYKITNLLGIPTTYAYTKEYNYTFEQPAVIDLSQVSEAGEKTPIIYMNVTGKSHILVGGGKILINAEKEEDLDKVVCAFDLALLEGSLT